MFKQRVVIKGHLPVQSHQPFIRGDDQRVNFDQGRIFLHKQAVQIFEHLEKWFHHCGFQGGQPQTKRKIPAVIPLKTHSRINGLLQHFLGCMFGHFLDIHAPFGAGNKGRPPGVTIHQQTEIELLRNSGTFFNQQPTDLSAFRSRLVRDEGLADQLFRNNRNFFPILGKLHPAGFSPSSSVNLSFDDIDRGLKSRRPFFRRARIFALFSLGNGNAKLGK